MLCRRGSHWRHARESRNHLASHRFGDIGLDLQKIREVARERIRTGLSFVAGLNQSDVNANLIGYALDAAFKNVLHVQGLPDFADWFSGHDPGGGGRDDTDVLRVEAAEL